MLPPHHAAVHGRTGISEYFSRVFAARRLTFTFTESSVAVDGDIAIERLHYAALATAPSGETTEDVGKGIHIYARRADGTWQLVQDIWNSDR
jgi:ketosteroid isomerase-like protein